MTITPIKLVLPVFAVVVAGCSSTSEYAAPDAGFSLVKGRSAEATGHQSVWAYDRQQAALTAAQVQTLLQRKTIDEETAVQVALLNNKGLQAAYADLGDAAADAWQAALLPNPKLSVGVTGIGTPGLEAFKSVEAMLASSIMALATRPQRMEIAATKFRRAQLDAALKTLALAADTRKAWIRAVSAWETVGQLSKAQAAADAASAIAQRLGETGAMTKEAQAREHVFFAELAGETAKARMEARLAKEELTRLMGLWGEQTAYRIPNQLSPLPPRLSNLDAIEGEALQRRIDLQMARLDLEAAARSGQLTEATRWVSDLDLAAGVSAERSNDSGVIKTDTTAHAQLDFSIPIFDSGQASKRKAELAYMRAANLLAAKAVNVRSEARSAYEAYRSSYSIAVHYRSQVLPLRNKIEEQSQLTYNGMISNTFELLADSRAKVDSALLSTNAKRDFRLAEVGVITAIYGGGTGSAAGEAQAASGSGQ